jgi:leucine-rich repeat protein SHOC2
MKKPANQNAGGGGAVSTGNKMLDSALARAKQSGNLTISDRQLKNFPNEIIKFEDLQIIENWWEGMPLTKIDLSNNEIPTVPEEISIHEELAWFNMSNNKLQAVPNSLFSLKMLKFLDLSYNGLTILSESLGQAHSLVELRIAGNQIRELPRSIQDCSNLEVLDAKRNKLVGLPAEFGCLQRILRLDIEEN